MRTDRHIEDSTSPMCRSVRCHYVRVLTRTSVTFINTD